MTYTIHEAKTHFSKLIEKVLNGEEVIIKKRGREIVRICPVEQRSFKNLIGILKGKVKMSEDFNAPLEDFEDYM